MRVEVREGPTGSLTFLSNCVLGVDTGPGTAFKAADMSRHTFRVEATMVHKVVPVVAAALVSNPLALVVRIL